MHTTSNVAYDFCGSVRGPNEAMTELRYRHATTNDVMAIFAVLEQVAAEIPLRLDGDERKERMLAQVRRCCDLGDSWVALEHDHEIVGFLLAEPDEWERRGAYGDTQVLNLPYAGVIESHRGRRIFPALARQMMAKGVALTATVKRANKRHMLSGLLKLGFTKADFTDDQDDLRWQPPRS